MIIASSVAMWIENQEHWTLRKRSSPVSPINIASLSFLWTTITVLTTPVITTDQWLGHEI